MTNAILPVRTNDVQDTPMPRTKKVYADRVEVRLDPESAAALQRLLADLGSSKSQSDIIREAIIEKDKRNEAAKKRQANV